MKRKINKKNILLIAIPVVLIIGLIVYIKVSDYYYDIKAKQFIGQKMNESIGRWNKNSSEISFSDEDFDDNTSSRELTDSELEILNLYDNLEYKSNDYLSDNKLTEVEKELLNDNLEELIDALKNEHINGMASVIGILSDDSATDTMTSFTSKYLQALEEEKQILTSYWDKIYNKEKIIDSHKEKYQKSLDYLKTLSTPLSDNSETDDSDHSLEDSSDVTTTYTAKSKMPFKKGEMVDVWGKATREKGANNFLIDADNGWIVDCSNVEDFTKLELLVDGENVTFTGKVIGEYKIKFQKVKVDNIDYFLNDFKEDTIYSEGMYKVGVDIPAGEYVLLNNSYPYSAYMCISNDANRDDILENDNFDYNQIVTLKNNQYLTLVRCEARPIDEVKNLDTSGEGVFKVGKHIKAGEYKLKATSDDFEGYYCIYSNTADFDIVDNDNFKNNSYVNVKNGQYLKLVRCEIQK